MKCGILTSRDSVVKMTVFIIVVIIVLAFVFVNIIIIIRVWKNGVAVRSYKGESGCLLAGPSILHTLGSLCKHV